MRNELTFLQECSMSLGAKLSRGKVDGTQISPPPGWVHFVGEGALQFHEPREELLSDFSHILKDIISLDYIQHCPEKNQLPWVPHPCIENAECAMWPAMVKKKSMRDQSSPFSDIRLLLLSWNVLHDVIWLIVRNHGQYSHIEPDITQH